jgi:C-terminal processing protease CtpA/Prc
MVLERDTNPKAWHYARPVTVLMDGGCFSATDVFLGAFKGWRGVTLIGSPSGGGSGRTRGYRLPHSGLELRLSSMASFQPNGKLYDGNGIEPDVLLLPAPRFFTSGEDRILVRCLAPY